MEGTAFASRDRDIADVRLLEALRARGRTP
jgi:hypothetical protein